MEGTSLSTIRKRTEISLVRNNAFKKLLTTTKQTQQTIRKFISEKIHLNNPLFVIYRKLFIQ